ncbi:TPA: restriction endonuclease subunit S [Haemophilus influenzae]|uniref:restriction endonuclease subunit S n=2 Tax=Haemophilus influenzae TaxID=727 RepID=UPI000CFF3B10|nr:restriction endonuclease subunit S [Haemophilus influenzae]PRJ30507.1 EcoKI restriction-modification system protein HsdS [Haemophilus influenzae]PRJ78883.1 EcoKI restriction-modification system protein HsdS [Haemophilus influenzae]PRJ82678.1 EcoKI restriction-modification system protein HsdS [Haemophilus influenzae]VTP75729.1 type I restriction/modification specificity protein [Haemophilus influenzae]
MSNWKEYRLGDCIEFIIDNRGKNPPLSNNGYELIETISINSENKYPDYSKISKFVSKDTYNNWFRKGHPKKGDILISTVGANIGRVSIMNENRGCIAQNLIGLRTDKEKLVPDYLYYFLIKKSTQHTLSSLNIGSAQPSIKVPHLLNILINVPNIQRQEEIANILSSLDEKIEINTQINQTLEQIAQALFKSWFVDFDPVRAKVQALSDGLNLEQAELAAMQAISGKTPEELTALSQTQPDRYAELAETAKAFPCEMVEVDGVEVPKGWEMKALSDLGQIICGKTPSKSNKEFYGNEVPFIKIPDMHNQAFITQTTDNLSLSGANSQSKKYIPPKSICVSCIATVGLVSMTSKPSHTNQQINSIIPNDEQTSEFLYLSLKQPSMTKYLKDLASGGSATLNLNTSTFSKIEIMTPSKEIIDIFHNKVVYAFEKVLSNSIENKRLAEIRDLLLPNLLNGESDE